VSAVKDAIITAALALGLATLITVHVALSWRLFWGQRPRWRGLVALVIPPLGLIWARRAGWKGTVGMWLGAVTVYLAALIAALAGSRT
jgi:drug/metabolite transporter (DMT)-like permease